MEDEDTWVGPAPRSDLDRACAVADTDEWDATEPSIEAQGSVETQMFEDTGVIIIDKPAAPDGPVTFRQRAIVTSREPTRRASTAEDWPPVPREPAPQIHDRVVRRAAVYQIVARPES